MIAALARDTRYTLRVLAKRPGFVGAGASWLGSRAVERLLPDQVVVTPITLAAVSAILFAAALAATAGPALRAAATDPVEVLRHE